MKPHHPCSSHYSQISFATIMLLAVVLNVHGQTWTQYDQGTPPQHAAGVSPVGSYVSADIGTVNLGNGALNLSLPMGTVGGRGFSIPLSLNYSSKVWSVAHDEDYVEERNRFFNMAYASYGAEESYVDIYNRLAPGWTIGGVPILKLQTSGLQFCENGYPLYALVKLTVVLPDKGEIELRDDESDGAPLHMGCSPTAVQYRGRRWHATDGSGMIFISDNDNGIVNADPAGTLVTADGMRYRFQSPSQSGGYGGAFGRCVSITDRNGNQISINHFADPNNINRLVTEYTDQMGRLVKVEESAPDPANPSVTLPLLVTIKGYQGTPQYYKVKTDLLSSNIRSDFNYNGEQILTGYDNPWGNCFKGGEPPPAIYVFPTSYCMFKERIDNKTQVTQLILPDGRSLQFRYNLHGELAEVVLPTGAKMQYDYSGNTGGFPAGNTLPMEYQGQGNAVHIDRAVTERRTYPDGATLEGTFTYAFAPQTVNGTSYACAATKAYAGTTTSGTLLSHQRHFFLPRGRYLSGAAGSVSGTGYSLWSTGVEWRTEVLDEFGNVISASEQEWARRTPVVWTSGYAQQEIANDNRTSETRRYLDDGSFAKTEIVYDDINYPRANNVSEVREYDFDQSFKRLAKISYVTGSYQTDEAIHLLSLVQQQSVYSDNNATNEVARTVNEYDVYVDDGNHALLQDYGTVIGHDNAYGLSKIARGNLTATGRWLKTNDTTTYAYLRYDTLGNPVASKDANEHVTTLSYADDFGDGSSFPVVGVSGNFGATYALPTRITSPPLTAGAPVHTARSQFDFWSGQLTGFKDRNGVITQTIYNDPFGRPTLVKSALGSGVETHAAMFYAPSTAFGITLTNNDVLTAKDQTNVNDATLRAWTQTDGFGRTVGTWSRAPEGNVKVKTDYDALGRVRQQSNPFRPLSEPAVYTTTAYDLAGRLKSVASPDGSVVNTYYSGSKVLVKDQSERERLSQTNGLGLLTDVWEILALEEERQEFEDSTEAADFPNHPEVVAGFRTKYAYDTLGNLTTVTQRKGTTGTTQTRTYEYNSLSQLTDAANPESGHIVYDYDPNGNLWHKTDARLVTATYEYDALNRNKSIVYSNDPADTPAVTRLYDGATNGKGRPWKTETGGARGSRTTVNSFDDLGRPINQSQQFYASGHWSQSYTVERAYDLAGHVLTQTYPSGHAVNYAYDAAGRTSSFSGNLGEGVPRTYADDFQYTAMGGLQQEKFGTDTALYHKQRYNERGQLWDMRLSTVPYSVDPGNDDRGSLINYYSSNFLPGGSGTDNNGNLLRQQIFIPGSGFFQDDFVYDSLNRLKSISEKLNGAGETFKQAYTFDRWGNRTIDQTSTIGDVPHPEFTVNAANNRLNAPAGYNFSYDEAGNLIDDSTNQNFAAAIYDAENRLAQVSRAPVCFPDGEGGQICNPSSGPPSEYVYDGDGRRVRRLLGGPFVQDEIWQVYGFDGELLGEYPRSGTPVIAEPQQEYGYRNGQLLVIAERWTNVALNKPTSQIDNYSAINMAAKAVNGDANGVLANGATSATNSHVNSWWQVDLQSVQTIASLTVWGRTDCCPQQTSDFYVFVSDVPFTSYDLNTTLAQPGVSNYYHAGFSGPSPSTGPTSINVNRTGRYVRVQLLGTNHLVLGEVQVWSQAAKVNWLVTDHLGTPRIIVDKTGSLAGVSRHDYLPFGEEIFADTAGRMTTQGYSAADGVRQKFTKYERDNETGLDYAQARYYAVTQGRFTSVDPLYFQGMMAIDPQRFNLYAYTRGNPLKFIDPSGEKVFLGGNTDWLKTNVLYEMVGGQENFDRYFQITDGQVVARAGVDASSANAGVQELLGLVNATENYLYFAGTNGTAAADLFQGSSNDKGKTTSEGKNRAKRFEGNNPERQGGTLVGTTGRDSTDQPANLANGDPVFAVIAYNTNAVLTQTGISNAFNFVGFGSREGGATIETTAGAAQLAGLNQVIRPVSFFIHESAENRNFAERGASNSRYPRAHKHAMLREATISRELNITGGFAGGAVQSRVPKQ